MSSILATIADAIVDKLNNNPFCLEFVAERSWADWDETLEEMGKLHIDVVPMKPDDADIDGRGGDEFLLKIHVGIRQRFGQASRDSVTRKFKVEELDSLVELAEQVHRFFSSRVNFRLLPGQTIEATWQQTVMQTICAREHLREKHQFTALILLTYKVHADFL